jgi:hypothetical protein
MKILLPVAFIFCINAFSLQARACTHTYSMSAAIDTSRTDSSQNIRNEARMYSICNVNNENMFSTRKYSSDIDYKQITEQTSDYGDHPYRVSDILTIGVMAVIVYALFATLGRHNN